MRLIATIFLIVFSFLNSQSQDSTLKDWQTDIKYLQDLVHKEYSFLFDKITKVAWDSVVEEVYNDLPAMAPHERVAGLARIISAFGYGHTRMRWGSFIDLHQVPINLYYFSDGIFIQGARSEFKDIVGAKVLEIEGIKVEDVWHRVQPVIPAENEMFSKAYYISYLTIPEVLHAQGIMKQFGNEINFTLEKDGETFTRTIQAEKNLNLPDSYSYILGDEKWISMNESGLLPLYLQNLDKIYSYAYLAEEKALYVRQSQIQDDPSEDIPSFYNKIFDFIGEHEVEKLILDVRLNGGGNNYKNKPVVKGIIKTENIDQVGNFFVLTGRRTFSACQNLVNELDNYTNAIFIGEPTGENINFFGDNNRVELPNIGGPVYLSFAWWQDKPAWENDQWLSPHVGVELSSEDFKAGRDPVLETALSFEDGDFILDPMQHLTDLFMQGNVEQLQKDATLIAKDPRYRFFDFEGQFSRAGERILNYNQVKEAIFVFKMITDLFPESGKAWNNLANALFVSGELDQAVSIYKKVIDMDTNGKEGQKAKEALEKIQSQEKK